MGPVIRVLNVLAVAAALACGGAESGSGDPAAEGAPAVENAAPDFTLKDLDGNAVTLSALRGKTVVIDFWATWCPPCEFQIPILNEVYAAHPRSEVEILGISVDTDGPDVVRKYIQKHGAVYPILLGSESLAREFGAPGFPSLMLISPEGGIEQIHVGLIEAPELEAAIAEVSGSGPAEEASPEPAGPA